MRLTIAVLIIVVICVVNGKFTDYWGEKAQVNTFNGRFNERINFGMYYEQPEIDEYLFSVGVNYPDIVKTVVIGQSYEGRNITLVEISTGQSEDKPTLFVNAGSHGREWICPASALYFIYQLVENPTNRHLIEDANWVILPLSNPDSYVKTWTYVDRLWSKTVSKGQQCDGVDFDSNFDFEWGERGSASDECSEYYRGPWMVTESEVKALRTYLLNAVALSNVALYLNLRSYGPLLLYPFGYTPHYIDNWIELDDVANSVRDAIETATGTHYFVGSINTGWDYTSGSSEDWAVGYANISLAYSMYMPRGGHWGYDVPEDKIEGMAEETWIGLLVLHDYIVKKYIDKL